MSLVFTDYVRSLESASEPTPEMFDAAWTKLHDALRSEMIQRSVWSAPPSYLGIYGWNSWSLKDALEELLSDCYLYVFVRRLQGLQALLAVQENIEGLVFRNIRYFLFEKQKRHDPLGYRVFRVLQTAARQSIAAGALHVLAGDPRVGNGTILGVAPESDPATGPVAELSELVGGWSDGLLPELVTARGARLDEAVGKLAARLARLADGGIEAFRFKDLIDPLKREVRARWGAFWLNSQGDLGFEDGDRELAGLVRLVRPDSGFEERDSFQLLLACVAENIDRLETREKTRLYLERLWAFLRSHAAEEEPAEGRGSPAASKPPSRRRLAELLGIPRYRLPDLHESLGRLVETCRSDRVRPVSPGGGTVNRKKGRA